MGIGRVLEFPGSRVGYYWCYFFCCLVDTCIVFVLKLYATLVPDKGEWDWNGMNPIDGMGWC